MPDWTVRLVLCLLPIALTPLLALAIGEGYLDFGGGDKDVVLLIPWLAWSLLYAIFFAVCWVRRLSPWRSVAFAAGLALVVLAVVGAGLFWYSGAAT